MDHTYEECIDEETIARLKDVEWPTYTILCPLYKEAPVVAQFVQAIKQIDYPVENLQILLLTEANDPETREALFRLDLPAHFSIVTVPPGTPQTKPRACNYGLVQATGEYIVIYDAEDIMDPLQLKRAVLAFANHGPEIVCVQAKLNFYNLTQNLLTRWFTAEYSSWYDLILPGLQRLRLPLPLGGTSNHFRSEVLRALGGWDAFNVTEDCDLGLRLSRYQLDTIVLDSTTYEEANSQFKGWIRQRSRWIKGYAQTYLVHMRHPLRMLRKGQYRQFISLQLLIAGKIISLFLNPFLWLMVAAFFLFRPWVETFYHQIFRPPYFTWAHSA
jgi:cellulose synthase/poly-beta-1,6-N-acetylglucosamine synthase-like glycosyltransferase